MLKGNQNYKPYASNNEPWQSCTVSGVEMSVLILNTQANANEPCSLFCLPCTCYNKCIATHDATCICHPLCKQTFSGAYNLKLIVTQIVLTIINAN